MCGIAAIIGSSQNEKIKITSMIDSIKHRGPDDTGYFFQKMLKWHLQD